MDGRTDGWMHGFVDAWMDGWKKRPNENLMEIIKEWIKTDKEGGMKGVIRVIASLRGRFVVYCPWMLLQVKIDSVLLKAHYLTELDNDDLNVYQVQNFYLQADNAYLTGKTPLT